MSGRRLKASRTYLEMRDPSSLSHATLPDAACRVERVLDCPPAFWRFLYAEIGRAHQWVDRLPWSPAEIRAYLADPAVTLWLLTVWGAPAGYFELRQRSRRVDRDRVLRPVAGVPGTRARRAPADAGRSTCLGRRRDPRVGPHEHPRSSLRASQLPQAGFQGLQDGRLHRSRLTKHVRATLGPLRRSHRTRTPDRVHAHRS